VIGAMVKKDPQQSHIPEIVKVQTKEEVTSHWHKKGGAGRSEEQALIETKHAILKIPRSIRFRCSLDFVHEY
jgi:hypothetical protein